MEYPSASEFPRFSVYSQDEIFYHIKQCELSGLVTKVDWFMGPGCLIHDLSPAGHEFLAITTGEKLKKLLKTLVLCR